MKKLKSKSLILDNIINEVDEQLSAVPTNYFDGTPIEDSLEMDMLVDGISSIHFVDGIGRKHYPFNKTVATMMSSRTGQAESKIEWIVAYIAIGLLVSIISLYSFFWRSLF